MKTVEFHRPDGKKINIEIIKYQCNDPSRNATPDRHRHEFHSIFFILGGSTVQEIDFDEYQIGQNQIMVIPKGAIHWEKTNHHVSGFVILFTDDFFSEVQRQLLNGFLQYAIASRKLLIPVQLEKVEQLQYYFELLFQEQEESINQNQTFLLQNLMLALLNKLEGLIQHLSETNSFIATRRPFQRFIELVEHNFSHHKALKFYTTELNLTGRKLNEIIKRITGQTASGFIIDRVIIEAKRELCFGEKSIKEIAHLLGYENQYYFSRVFKKKVGMSPESFRSQFAE